MEKATLICSLTTWVKIIDITQNQWINVSGINRINWVICTQTAWNPLRLRADWVCRNPWSCCFSQTQYQVLSEWLEMHNHTDAKAQTKWAAFISLSRIAHHWKLIQRKGCRRPLNGLIHRRGVISMWPCWADCTVMSLHFTVKWKMKHYIYSSCLKTQCSVLCHMRWYEKSKIVHDDKDVHFLLCIHTHIWICYLKFT